MPKAAYRRVVFLLVQTVAALTAAFFGLLAIAAAFDQISHRGWGYRWADAFWSMVGCLGALAGIRFCKAVETRLATIQDRD